MIGADIEHFMVDGAGLAQPALLVLEEQTSLKVRKIHRKLAVDIAPDGYDSLVVRMGKQYITEDGLAMEFTTEPGSPGDVVASMQKAIKAEWVMAKELGLQVMACPTIWFDGSHLKNRPELRVLGCNPDLSIGASGPCRPAQDPRRINWRTSGGHIHLSVEVDFKHPSIATGIVLACDTFLGLLDVAMANDHLAKHRREMYGQPGKYRIQKWGIEYRTPTAAWTVNSNLAMNMLTVAEQIMNLTNRRTDWLGLLYPRYNEVSDAILNCDRAAAVRLLQEAAGQVGIELEIPKSLDSYLVEEG